MGAWRSHVGSQRGAFIEKSVAQRTKGPCQAGAGLRPWGRSFCVGGEGKGMGVLEPKCAKL
ncbi:hypothetical protein EDC62_2092 [Tibeticola sediminis]|jgi:hypothetical protein|uniref:Uncharacterized protein n=1 Tax=Tibeticola sediminis TaxID=1917811 RepID=A0A3N4U5B1_9BURK|nr:hypothetical protein EDC62_2092 [Tibeticola sediminis]